MKKNRIAVIGFLILFVSCHQKEKRKMDSIQLNNGLTVKCKSLSKEEYNSSLKDTPGSSIKRFKEKYNIDVHQLRNGQVLVKEDDYYTLYYNLGDLDMVLLNASGYSQGVEILRNKNIYGSDFPAKTDSLINQLCISLSIEYKETNEQLLKEVDTKINKLKDPELFREGYFINFIALIGESLIKKHQARWEMKIASDGSTWNPYLIINDHRVQFFTYLYEDIFISHSQEDHLLFEIYETVNAIREHNLKG